MLFPTGIANQLGLASVHLAILGSMCCVQPIAPLAQWLQSMSVNVTRGLVLETLVQARN